MCFLVVFSACFFVFVPADVGVQNVLKVAD